MSYSHILPSLLAANFASLKDAMKPFEEKGMNMFHFDVMDGHFVPNISFGLPVLASLCQHTTAQFDVHLMIDNPLAFAENFLKVGAKVLTFHVETVSEEEGRQLIKLIHHYGAKAGISLKPNTPLETLDALLPFVDVVLVMGVEPGFGGQAFIPNTIDRIHALSVRRNNHQESFLIEVDGGIDDHSGRACLAAGCDWLVAGSYLFGHKDLDARLETLK